MLAAGLVAAAAALSAAAPASPVEQSGFAVLVDAHSGRQLVVVKANGIVDDAVADGRGGWFVGGSFTRFGGKRRIGLAHLLPDGRVDPAWRAWIGGATGRRGDVVALARSGTRLFVGGAFGRIDGVTRPGLGAVDTATGELAGDWRPQPRVWIDVEDLAVAAGRLLVAGPWGKGAIQALDTRTGSPQPGWRSVVDPIPDAGSVELFPSGSRIFVAGAFHVDGLRRNSLAALDARTGLTDRRWAPHPSNCPECRGFAVIYGLAVSSRHVFVSGDFRKLNGEPRNGLAAVDPRTGRLDPGWRPAVDGTRVYALALTGSRLYLGGAGRLTAVESDTGARIDLPVPPLPGDVNRLAVSGRRLLAVGGS